jgi:hypothetical protein
MNHGDQDDSTSVPDSFAGLPSGEFDYDMYRAGKKRRRLRDRKAWLTVVVGLTIYILVEVFITKGALTEAIRRIYF